MQKACTIKSIILYLHPKTKRNDINHTARYDYT